MCCKCLQFRVGCFLPQPLTAGGGDVVMLAAGADGCLDFSLAALKGKTEGGFWCHSVIFHFSLAPQLTWKEPVTTAHEHNSGEPLKITDLFSFEQIHLAATCL